MKNENLGFCQNSYGCIFSHFVSLFPCFNLPSEGFLISAIKSQNCQWNQQCLEFVPNLYCSLTIKGTKLVKELTPAHKINKQIGLHIWASILQAVQACFKYAMLGTLSRPKNRSTDRQAVQQTDQLTDRQTFRWRFHWQTDQQTVPQTNRQTDWQNDQQTDRQTNRIKTNSLLVCISVHLSVCLSVNWSI